MKTLHPKTAEILRAAARRLEHRKARFSCVAVATEVQTQLGEFCICMFPERHPITEFYQAHAWHAGRPDWWDLWDRDRIEELRQLRIDALNAAAAAADKILKEQK